MGSNISFYNNNSFTPGIPNTPDTMSFFIVPENEGLPLLTEHRLPIMNFGGYCLLISLLSGMIRVGAAVKLFFEECYKIQWKIDDPHLKNCWIASQNFCRGIIEITPFTGLFLFLYDYVHCKVVVQSQIEKELQEEKEKGVSLEGKAGVFFDGRVRAMSDLKKMIGEQEGENLSNEQRLERLSKWIDAIEKGNK